MQKTSVNRHFSEMKRTRQKTDAYCGPAAMEMLASFIKISINQNKFVHLSKMDKKINKYGMNINDLGKGLKTVSTRCSFWYKEKSTTKELSKLVNDYKYPVGVEWQGVFEEYTEKDFPDDGHYGVVTYINSKRNKIYISDPFRRFAMKDRIFELDFFRRRWWDFNELKDHKKGKMVQVKDHHMMFIITKPNVTFPLELGMTKYK